MCLAVPLKIKEIEKDWAVLENGKKVNLKIVGRVKKGDYLLTRGHLAVDLIDKKEAKEILNSFKRNLC